MGIVIHDIGDFSGLDKIIFTFTPLDSGRKKKGHYECTNIMSYDIETSTGYRYGDTYIGDYSVVGKDGTRTWAGSRTRPDMAAIMYVWQFGIQTLWETHVFLGRTWTEFEWFLRRLNAAVSYSLSTGCAIGSAPTASYSNHCIDMHIYVHNLQFEFQFLRNVLTFGKKDVFARTMRNPMRAIWRCDNNRNIYHDTLVLTQKSLENWAKDAKLTTRKAVGNLDYNAIRTPITPLTAKEIEYCVNDVLVVIEGVEQYRKKYGLMANIPMTQTGEIRRTLVEKVAKADPEWESLMRYITYSYSFEDLVRLQNVYWGGWTHACSADMDQTLRDVYGNDFTSSFSATMCMDKYPVSVFEQIDPDDLPLYQDEDHCYYLTATFHNLRSAMKNTLIPAYKVQEGVGCICDNGKIWCAEKATIAMIDRDWILCQSAYTWDSVEITDVYVCDADYLPKVLIETILDYFMNKCQYDGVPGMETLYTESKQFINSIYGVAVTRVIINEILFNGDWESIPTTEEAYEKERNKAIEKWVNACEKHREPSDHHFLCYQIGVWVAGWARYHLWELIIALDNHATYGDTDSNKGRWDAHDLDAIEAYNRRVDARVAVVCTARGIDPARYIGTKPNGKKKHLGYFAPDMFAKEFRTLGAKRYAYIDGDDELHVVVAGVPKRVGALKLASLAGSGDVYIDDAGGLHVMMNGTPKPGAKKLYSLGCSGESPIDYFSARPHNGKRLCWSARESGKLTHYYIDDQPETVWRDKDDNIYVSHDKYAIALDAAEYDMTMDEDYIMLATAIQTGGDMDTFPGDIAYIIDFGKKKKGER